MPHERIDVNGFKDLFEKLEEDGMSSDGYLSYLEEHFIEHEDIVFDLRREDGTVYPYKICCLYFMDGKIYTGMIPSFFLEVTGSSKSKIKEELMELIAYTVKQYVIHTTDDNKEASKESFLSYYGVAEAYQLMESKGIIKGPIERQVEYECEGKAILFEESWAICKDMFSEKLVVTYGDYTDNRWFYRWKRRLKELTR